MKLKNLLAALFLFSLQALHAQTTYTWIGGNGSWAVAGNWSPTRTTPANTDIIQFDDGGTYTVTAIPTQTIRQLLISSNTNITLQAAAANTLTINGPTLTNNLVIENGGTLQTSAINTQNITMTTTSNQRADISGTLNIRAGTFATSGTTTNIFTVSSTGIVNHFGGTITGSAPTFVFNEDATYNYLGSSTGLTIPTASWDANSNVTITGVTNGIPLGLNQNFGKILWDCAAQSAAINLTTFPITVTSFEVRNTNNQFVANNFGTRNWTTNGAGDLLITGGRLAIRGTLTSLATLTVNNLSIDNTLDANAQLTINNGTSTTTNAVTLNVAGNLVLHLAQNSNHTNILEFRGVNNISEVINLSGNFTQTGNNTGRISRTNSLGTQNFVFSNGTSTYSTV